MDGISVLYNSTDTDPLYKFGNAHGWLARSCKTAGAEYHLSGRLYLAKSGWLLLSVPNALVRGVFDAMSHAGAELPLAGTMNVPNVDKDLLNAHISVLTADEVAAIGANKINERGHSFKYSLGPVKEITPNNIDGVSKIWAIQIASPELSALRKSYGLSALPNDDHPFHITVAVRKRNVLRENDVSKFDTASGRGELKAAAAEEMPWRERVEVYTRHPQTGNIYGGVWVGDNSFAVPGGGLDPGETPEQAAIRELAEETGIQAANPVRLPIAPVDYPWSDKTRAAKAQLGRGNFAGSRTHFVMADFVKQLKQQELDKWQATDRKFYSPDAALALMQNKQFGAPAVAAGRMAVLQHIIDSAAKKTAAEVQPRVRVVLPYKGQYLLETLNNSKWPQNIGKRRFIGGGVEAGETPEQAASRELFEELGVKIKPTAFRPLGNDPREGWQHEQYVELAKHKLKPGDFNATVGSDPVITLSSGLPAGDDYMGPDIKKLLAPIIQKAATSQLSRSGQNDLLPGGKADNMPDRDFSSKELAIGVADEHEHTSNDQIAKEIAKDHLQEDPAYYEKEKLNSVRKTPQIILQLLAAKEHSDNKRYEHKNQILQQLMTEAPQEWVVDDPNARHMGITHTPTKFRFHADPRIIPPVVPVSKAAGTNPYFAQLFNSTQPLLRRGNSPVLDYLKATKERGDRQISAEQNTRGLLAELNPAYKQQLHASIVNNTYPRPDFVTRLIHQHGDGVLNALG